MLFRLSFKVKSVGLGEASCPSQGSSPGVYLRNELGLSAVPTRCAAREGSQQTPAVTPEVAVAPTASVATSAPRTAQTPRAAAAPPTPVVLQPDHATTTTIPSTTCF